MNTLNESTRIDELRDLINKKKFLKNYYIEIYSKYLNCLKKCPQNGKILEIGSGAGFAKTFIPNLITSDIIPYNGIDMVIDATKLPFENESISVIFMMNVFHHIPDVQAFFNEARRCLMPNGRIFMMEPYLGWISTSIYKYVHHEPMNIKAKEWKFNTTGPLSDANIALPWIVFKRDINTFEKLNSDLRIAKYEQHTPLRYWLSGGLKKWNLVPGCVFSIATSVDRFLIGISKEFASFVDIELYKEKA